LYPHPQENFKESCQGTPGFCAKFLEKGKEFADISVSYIFGIIF